MIFLWFQYGFEYGRENDLWFFYGFEYDFFMVLNMIFDGFEYDLFMVLVGICFKIHFCGGKSFWERETLPKS